MTKEMKLQSLSKIHKKWSEKGTKVSNDRCKHLQSKSQRDEYNLPGKEKSSEKWKSVQVKMGGRDGKINFALCKFLP